MSIFIVGPPNKISHDLISNEDRLTHDPLKRPFRALLKKFRCPQLPYLVTNRTRYSIMDIASDNIHRFSLAIYIFYLMVWPSLKSNDKTAFNLFRTVYIRSVIKIRGAIANNVLLPWMKTVATIDNVADYNSHHSKMLANLSKMKVDPSLLFDNYKMDCINLQPLLALILTNNGDFNSCLHILTQGSLGLSKLTLPADAAENTILVARYNSNYQLTEETPEEETHPTHIEEPDGTTITSKRKDVNADVTLADVTLTSLHKQKSSIAELYPVLIQTVIDRLKTMDAKFFEQTEKQQTLHFSTTTRSVERTFGYLKDLLARNGQTRAILLWAHGVAHMAAKSELTEACVYTSDELHRTARNIWKNQPVAAKYDMLFFNKFMAKVASDWKRETKKIFEDALRAHLLKTTVIINVETTMITNNHLFEYLEFVRPQPRTMPNKNDKKEILMQECVQHFPDYLQKLYWDDVAEKKKYALEFLSHEKMQFIDLLSSRMYLDQSRA